MKIRKAIASIVLMTPLLFAAGAQRRLPRPGPQVATGQVLTWNGTSWVAQSPAAPGASILAAGTITLTNATSASHTFTTALPAGAICQVQPIADPATLPGLTYWPTYGSASVTVNMNTPGTGTFNFMCTAAAN